VLASEAELGRPIFLYLNSEGDCSSESTGVIGEFFSNAGDAMSGESSMCYVLTPLGYATGTFTERTIWSMSSLILKIFSV
jgi:hypothetical protein